jgi:hypothetical protein
MNGSEKLKALKEATCEYPMMDEDGTFKACGKEQFMSCALPCVTVMESGKEKDEPIQIPVPFCEYHAMIALHGLFYTVMKDGQPKYLKVPGQEIMVAEAVIESYAVTGKLTELLKGIKAAEESRETPEAKDES